MLNARVETGIVVRGSNDRQRRYAICVRLNDNERQRRQLWRDDVLNVPAIGRIHVGNDEQLPVNSREGTDVTLL